MGGHGAIKLAMLYPDRFGIAYGLNPSVLGWSGDLSPDNPAIEPISTIEELEDLADANFYVQALSSSTVRQGKSAESQAQCGSQPISPEIL